MSARRVPRPTAPRPPRCLPCVFSVFWVFCRALVSILWLNVPCEGLSAAFLQLSLVLSVCFMSFVSFLRFSGLAPSVVAHGSTCVLDAVNFC